MWDEPLWVVVDNTSPSIRYEGQWTARQATPDVKNFLIDGPPFSQSLRAPSRTASVLFDFIGSRVQVQGTINNPGNLNVSITCQVDGEDLGNVHQGFDYQLNNFAFCDTYNIPSTKLRTLNFTVTVPEGNLEPMLFDRLIYIPSNATLNMDQALLSLDDTWLRDHDATEYDRFWTEFGDGSYTDTKGSKVVVNFNGTSLRWFGFWTRGEFPSRDKAMTSYSLDNQGGLPLEIPAISIDQFHYLNEPLLALENLSPGPHRLEVTYMSDSKTGRPLTLDYVVLQNAPVLVPSQTMTNVNPSPTTPGLDTSGGPVSASSTGLTQGTKIGIGVGVGIAGLLVLLLTLWYLRHRRRARQASLYSDDTRTQPAMSAYNQTSPAALTSPTAPLTSTSPTSVGITTTTGASIPSDGNTPIALMYHEDSGIRLDDEMNPRPVDDLLHQPQRPPTYRKGH